VSASTQADLLTQWVHYAQTDGFAIGLDTTGDWHIHGSDGRPVKYPSEDLREQRGWFDVIYDPTIQEQVTRELLLWVVGIKDSDSVGRPDSLSSPSAEEPAIAIRTLLLQLKHPAFADEREVRLVVSKPADAKEEYRVSQHRLVPYVRVGQQLWTLDSGPTLQIRGLVLGPGVRPGSSATARDFLRRQGYGDVPIATSEIPYVP
jgi:hypothetical protein